jgi:hypothetical protein
VALANDASSGLLSSGSVTKASANLLAVGVGAGVGLGFLGVGLFVGIVMAVVASILFLGLLMMKVVLAISTVLVFVGMSIAIVLSPVVSWIPRLLAQAFAVCLAVPLVWSICFAASGALLTDGLFLKGSSGFFDALLEPLAAIALLWVMLILPTRLARMAMLGAGTVGGGGWRQEDFDAEMLESSLREQHQPVSAEQARQAREALSPATQAAVRNLIAEHGPRARQHLAYQALGEWTPQEREAIRTLAAASPELRAQAFQTASDRRSGSARAPSRRRASGPHGRSRTPRPRRRKRPNTPAAQAPLPRLRRRRRRRVPTRAMVARSCAGRRISRDRATAATRESGARAPGGEASLRLGLHGRADRGDDRGGS